MTVDRIHEIIQNGYRFGLQEIFNYLHPEEPRSQRDVLRILNQRREGIPQVFCEGTNEYTHLHISQRLEELTNLGFAKNVTPRVKADNYEELAMSLYKWRGRLYVASEDAYSSWQVLRELDEGTGCLPYPPR